MQPSKYVKKRPLLRNHPKWAGGFQVQMLNHGFPSEKRRATCFGSRICFGNRPDSFCFVLPEVILILDQPRAQRFTRK